MNDELYNKHIKQQLNTYEDAFFSDIKHDKQKTWELIEHRMKKKKVLPLWWYYAAVLFLILGTSWYFNNRLIYKNNEIKELRYQIAQLQNKKQQIKIIHQTDTLILTRQKTVNNFIVNRDTVIVYDTIIKLLVKKDTVFVTPKNENNIADVTKNNYQNNETIQKNNYLTAKNKKIRKKRKFILSFGKPTDDDKVYESSETLLTLRTRIK